MPSTADATNSVNPHYLGHVMATAEARDVEASEDIVTVSGLKLLAKGARIDPAARERLLTYRLRKSLENCVTVRDGVQPAQFVPLAERLLDEHTLLARLCGGGDASPEIASLNRLFLSAPVRSLLSVFDGSRPDRLRHAVGVAMIAMGIARRQRPGDTSYHQLMGLAGMLHDVGELYLDPQHFALDAPLQAERWRHIITHPLLGHRVLTGMEGAGPVVAQAVLLHHERLNGHGYPRCVTGNQLTLDGQIVGVAEWLMALVDSELTPISRASVACKLMPGEFVPELMQCLASAAPGEDEISWAAAVAPDTLKAQTQRLRRITDVLSRFMQSRDWIFEQLDKDTGDCKPLLLTAVQRLTRLQTAFSGTGLDTMHPDLLLTELASHNDPRLLLEAMTIVDELFWRLRDLQRRAWQREVQLKPEENAVMRELVARLKEGWTT